MAFRVDRTTLQPPRRRADGCLVVDGVLTRTGVFEYLMPDGGVRREYRPPEEVFHADALSSFALVPVTDDHPPELVTAENAKRYMVGMVGSRVDQHDSHVTAEMVIFDEMVIARIDAGKQELSCGYQVELDETPGVTPSGERYDAVQRGIKGNHVAIVEKGRAGPSARIKMDMAIAANLPRSGETPETKQEITMDEFEKRLAELAIEKAKAEVEAQSAIARADAADAAAIKLTAERDDARDKLAAAEQAAKERIDAADALNRGFAKLLATASKVTEQPIDKFDGQSARDIKVSVVEKLTGAKLDAAKDDAYVDARYDLAIENYSESREDKAEAAEVTAQDAVARERKAREDMMAKRRDAWKGN